MNTRTPSSLYWLINKQKRLRGRLAQLNEDSIALDVQSHRLRSEIESIETKLAALDTAMSLHDIAIDPLQLATIRPRRHDAVTEFGDMTRIVYRVIAGSPGGTAATPQILAALISYLDANKYAYDLSHVKKRLRKRLYNMARDGQIIRHQPMGPYAFREWRLPEAKADEP